MPGTADRINSILIVSGSEQFTALIRKAAAGHGFMNVDQCRSASAARRRVIDRQYDIVVINAPLQEEFGHELAMDMAEKGTTSVLMAVPSEVYDSVMENVTDYGVLVLSKPVSGSSTDRAVRFLMAEQKRFRALERKASKAEEKAEELRVVSKAKLLLIERKKMTEEEAHRLIGKNAMDHGVSRRRAAEWILEDLE